MFVSVLTVMGTVYVNINNICSVEKIPNGTKIKTCDGKDILTQEDLEVTIDRITRVLK